tara:strand:+ start:1605 stop:2306 length:702 start_codon:yes stop_codon:yes gene_type:complete
VKNREKTFYKLTNDSRLDEAYKLAETTEPDMFFKMGWQAKFGSNLRIYNNNIAFLDRLEGFENLHDLKEELQFQLANRQYNYTRKEWLEHTIFICKNRYRESGEEIFNEAIKWCKTPTKSRTTENKYSLKAVKIAYFLLREYINEQNYKEILKRHTTYTSNKILQNPIIKSLQLTALIEDKTAAEKHLKTLKEAEQLLNSGQMVTNGNKIKEALKALSQIISTFSSNKDTYYN